MSEAETLLTANNIVLCIKDHKKPGAFTLTTDGIQFKSSQKDSTIAAPDITSLTWQPSSGRAYQLLVNLKAGQSARFQGFKSEAFPIFQKFIESQGKTIQKVEISTEGHNWGDFNVSNSSITFKTGDKLGFEIPLSSIAQSNIQGKNEVSVEFGKEGKEAEGLIELRIYVSKDEDEAAVEDFHNEIVSKADLGEKGADAIASFENFMVQFPRGRFNFDLFDTYFKLTGSSNQKSFKVQHAHVYQMFMFPMEDSGHHMFIIGLNPPLRQGRTTYPYLILQFDSAQEIQVEPNMDEKVIEEKYSSLLSPKMTGFTHEIFSRLMKALTNKKVITPGSFRSSEGNSYIRCSLKANDGHLFILEKSFFFIKKPPTYIHHNQISSVEFSRAQGGTSSRSFDLKLILNDAKSSEYLFSGINREEMGRMYEFMKMKGLTIEETDGLGMMTSAGGRSERGRSRADVNYNEEATFGKVAIGDDYDSEEDEDFTSGSEESESSEDESDFSGAEEVEETNPVIDEKMKKKKDKKEKKKKKKDKKEKKEKKKRKRDAEDAGEEAQKKQKGEGEA